MLIEFIFPIYNEESILKENSLKLLSFLEKQNYSFNWKIVLVVNGSSDQSELISKELSEEKEKIDYAIIKEKGKGNAIKTYCDESKANFLIYMDIDLAVSVESLPRLVHSLEKESYDLALGSRFLRGSETKRSFIKSFISRFYIALSRAILRHPFSDLQCGFKGIKKEAWSKISPHVKDKAWFFDTEILLFSRLFHLKIKEVPVNWKENRYQERKSKLKPIRESFIFFKKLLKLKKRLKAARK
jgi:glycosyltransferase involved in cell wall biosynthesis